MYNVRNGWKKSRPLVLYKNPLPKGVHLRFQRLDLVNSEFNFQSLSLLSTTLTLISVCHRVFPFQHLAFPPCPMCVKHRQRFQFERVTETGSVLQCVYRERDIVRDIRSSSKGNIIIQLQLKMILNCGLQKHTFCLVNLHHWNCHAVNLSAAPLSLYLYWMRYLQWQKTAYCWHVNIAKWWLYSILIDKR